MLRIGITGGIGTGKTMVCKLFKLLGASVFYADAAAKTAMITDSTLIATLKTTFGGETYTDAGELNRSYLASIVFNNEEKLKQLNSLVHPAVFKAFDLWIDQQSAPYAVKEAALLFESGSYKDCDYTILVSSPTELRIQRVMSRDKITREQVSARISKQMPETEKAKMADFIIANNEVELLIPQVLALHKRFISESGMK